MQDHSCGTASMGPHDLSKWWHEAQQKVHHYCHLFWTRCFLFLRSSFAGSSFLRLYAKQLSLFTSFCIVFSGIDARGMLDSFHSCHTMAILSSCSFEFLLTSFSSAATSALLKSANTSFAFIWSTSWVEGIASGRWVNHGWSTDVLRLTVCHPYPFPIPPTSNSICQGLVCACREIYCWFVGNISNGKKVVFSHYLRRAPSALCIWISSLCLLRSTD